MVDDQALLASGAQQLQAHSCVGMICTHVSHVSTSMRALAFAVHSWLAIQGGHGGVGRGQCHESGEGEWSLTVGCLLQNA